MEEQGEGRGEEGGVKGRERGRGEREEGGDKGGERGRGKRGEGKGEGRGERGAGVGKRREERGEGRGEMGSKEGREAMITPFIPYLSRAGPHLPPVSWPATCLITSPPSFLPPLHFFASMSPLFLTLWPPSLPPPMPPPSYFIYPTFLLFLSPILPISIIHL